MVLLLGLLSARAHDLLQYFPLRSENFMLKLCIPGDLPKSRNQPSKRSKGPKVKFTIPLAAQHNDGDGMNCVSRGKPDPMFSSELFTSEFTKLFA